MPRRATVQDVFEEVSTNDESVATMASLMNDIKELRTLLQSQQNTIRRLENESSAESTSAPRMGVQTIKAPPIPIYSGKRDEKTTVKVKGFIYNVQKAGMLSNVKEEKLVELAECHFQDKSAAWIMRLEQNGTKPTTLVDLQAAMIAEFFPADEKARAKVRLMNLRMSKSLESHISIFQDLVEICGTPLSEAYLFFFMSLSGNFKQELTKKYPTGNPKNMQEVYEHARTIDLALQWSKEDTKKDVAKNSTPKEANDSKTGTSEQKNVIKDDKTFCWGPAKRHEFTLYRSNDRCFKCGLKGWSSDDHPCKDKKGKGKNADSKNE